MTMQGKIFAFFILAAGLFSRSAAAQNEMTARVLDDRVHLLTPATWLTSTRPRGLLFQVRNAGEDLHSNLPGLSIYDRVLGTAKESYDFQEEATRNVGNFQPRELVAGWDCRTWVSKPFATKTVNWDCRRIIGDFGVAVDVTWPHLAAQAPDYDARMEGILSEFLRGVTIH